MEKRLLRKKVIEQLKEKKSAEKKEQECQISEQLVASKWWKEAQTIGFTYPLDFEFNTLPLIMHAWSEQKHVVLPKVCPNHQMFFYLYEKATPLVESSFGVLEPSSNKQIAKQQIDLLVVPGVVFDSVTKKRIGFGGGFYDRYLADFTGKSCSLVFDEQLIEGWESETHDQAIDRLFTLERKNL